MLIDAEEEVENILSPKDFAVTALQGQLFNNNPFPVHLKRVIEVLSDFGYRDEWRDAAWLLYTPSHTKITSSMIRKNYGLWVTQMVYACNAFAPTQFLRDEKIYKKIELCQEAAILKAADRIAEVENIDPFSDRFILLCHEKAQFQDRVLKFVPYGMTKRLNAAYALRNSVRCV